MIHLVNGAQFLDDTFVAVAAITVISHFAKMQASLQSQRLDFKTSVL